MKNKSILLYVAITVICFNTACHKCVECTEVNSAGGKEIEYREVCGKKTQIDEYRLYMEGNVNPKNKVQCTERKTALF